MTEAEPARLAFDDVLIDFAGRRLFRGGVEQTLEPKAFAVLAFLAATPGHVFTRDEILDAVWGHRHVTPGVLNRIVTLVRQALGEDAQHARLLQTMYGVGYRFDVPPPVPTETEPESSDISTSAALAGGSRAAVPPQRAWRRASWSMLWLVAVVVLGASLVLRSVDSGTPVPAMNGTTATSAIAVAPTLVVMPLKSIGGADGTRVVAEGLGEELICSLAKIDGLRVIAHTSTMLATAQSGDAAELVRRLGITHSLEGNLQQAGQALRVRMRLVDALSGNTVWVKDFDREAAEVLGLQRDIARQVADSLALRMGLDPDAAAKSGDVEFVRRTMEARAMLARGDDAGQSSAEVAEREFRALVRERPDDARARAGLALVLTIRSRRSPELASQLADEALGEARIARVLDPTQPESWSVEAHIACARDEWERCLALREKARLMAPSNMHVVYPAVVSLAHLGYLDRAGAVARELATRDPLAGSVRFILGRILDSQGRHDEARVELGQVGAEGAYARWFNAAWRKDFAQALQIADTEIAAAPALALDAAFVATSHALLDPAAWPRAEAEFERSEREGLAWNFLRVFSPDADKDAGRAIRAIDALRRGELSSWQLLLWSRDLAWLRRDPSFQVYLRDSGILAYWRAHGFPTQCRADGDGAVCD